MVYNIEDRYEIRPHGNDLCWEIWEKRDVKNRETGKTENKWMFAGKYPVDFSDALEAVYRMAMKSGEGTIYGLKAAIAHAKDIEERIGKGRQ